MDGAGRGGRPRGCPLEGRNATGCVTGRARAGRSGCSPAWCSRRLRGSASCSADSSRCRVGSGRSPSSGGRGCRSREHRRDRYRPGGYRASAPSVRAPWPQGAEAISHRGGGRIRERLRRSGPPLRRHGSPRRKRSTRRCSRCRVRARSDGLISKSSGVRRARQRSGCTVGRLKSLERFPAWSLHLTLTHAELTAGAMAIAELPPSNS